MKLNFKVISALESGNRARIEGAFEEVYREYEKLIIFIVSRYVSSNFDVEEIVNDVFLAFFNNIEKVGNDFNIRSYLISIARNKVIDFYRKKDLNTLLIEENDCTFSCSDNANESYNELIESFKGFLTQEEIDILLLHIIYDNSFKEISATKKISLNTIASKYRRAVKKILFRSKQHEKK